MTIDYKMLRIEGIYNQNAEGDLMMRVKLSSGLLSVAQATVLAKLARQYGSGTLHLTTRGSIEFHDLRLEEIPIVQRGMTAVGLFSRGACGGAVRGISCSTGFGKGFAHTQQLARRLLLYFSGNPHFEGLPKKFKIAVEAGYAGSRHLIQDLAFVYVAQQGGQVLYDVWTAGGLGRAPQAAVLYRQRVPESDLLQLAEAIIRVYAANVKPPRRLKTLVGERGEAEFRQLVDAELERSPAVHFSDAYDKALIPLSGEAVSLKLTLPVFAGELPAERLAALAAAADSAGVSYLQVTADQDLALLPVDQSQRQKLLEALQQVDFADLDDPLAVLRVCPGNHECSMGLTATRDLATLLRDRFGDELGGRELAISGCPNSCAQPQLAELGIIASKSVKEEGGERTPRYDLYHRRGEGLGERIAERLTEAELFAALDAEF